MKEEEEEVVVEEGESKWRSLVERREDTAEANDIRLLSKSSSSSEEKLQHVAVRLMETAEEKERRL